MAGLLEQRRHSGPCQQVLELGVQLLSSRHVSFLLLLPRRSVRAAFGNDLLHHLHASAQHCLIGYCAQQEGQVVYLPENAQLCQLAYLPSYG
jgi:hypothetical protein